MKTLITLCLLCAMPAHAQRIKDLADTRSAETNQLQGYGLVVGLNGTGDSDKFRPTANTITSTLREHDQRVNAQTLKSKNSAVVFVTAKLPPYSQPGQTIDVTVSSFGDAKSLQGGVLMAAALKGHDGKTYVVAQGPLSVGGFSAGSGGRGEIRNHPTVARVPNGGMIERGIAADLSGLKVVDLFLRRQDFTTSARMAKVVNDNLGVHAARALDGRHVRVELPKKYAGRVPEFLAYIERLEVQPDAQAVVVINERTGTIVMGQDVRVAPVAIAHGNLTVSVRETNFAVPAAPMTKGKTVIEKNTDLKVTEEDGRLLALRGGANLAEVVDALNALGASPRDLITILQGIQQAGALRARLEIN